MWSPLILLVLGFVLGCLYGRWYGYWEGFHEGDRIRGLVDRDLLCTGEGCNAEVIPGHHHCAEHPDPFLCSACNPVPDEPAALDESGAV